VDLRVFILFKPYISVMWSETVGLRTRPVSDQKSVLVLVFVLQIWCCVVKHGLVTLVLIMILKDTGTATSQVPLIDLYSYKYQTYMYTVPIAKEMSITNKV